jgi:hypothetical protein
MSVTYGNSVILLNQNNATTRSNVFQYNFPSGAARFRNNRLAISSIIIPYSWYNITAAYGNNTFSLKIPTTDGVTNTTINVTIPDGFYTVAGINAYIQSVLIANNVGYLVNGSAQNVYYIEIVANSNLGTAQINSYVVPNALPAGWSNPATWALPNAGTRVPQIVINNAKFGTLIGFTNATYPAVQTQAGTYSITSNEMPQISPVSSLTVSCSLINNILSSPSNIIASIPITNTFGGQIIFEPNQFIWVSILDGSYPYFSLTFTDQSNQLITLTDTNVIATLIIE